MPFTLSHVAAVVPGFRPLSRAQVFAAAVIGSMVPDFGLLLLSNTLLRLQTHSVVGLFSFCLPVGLCAYWLTQLLIKPAVLEVVPDRAYLRLRAGHPSASITNLRHWLYAALALLFGAVTHLIWDGFTHEDARGVRMFPLLTDYGPEMAGHSLHLYGWLQYGSSILGLAVVAAALVQWWRHAPPSIEPPQRRVALPERALWLSLYLLPPLLMIAWSLRHSPSRTGEVIRIVAVTGMRGALVSLLLISALIRARLAC